MRDKFDELCDCLRFNIYNSNPDASILDFLRLNFPYLGKQPAPGGWTIYPAHPVEIPKLSVRSFHHTQHPFIKTAHNGVKIDFLTQEWTEGYPGIEQIRVRLYFANRLQAEETRENLVNEFLKTGAHVTESVNENEIRTTLYGDSTMDEFDSVVLLLSEDDEKRCSLLVLFKGDNENKW
jgi:hypothetical protein